MIEVDGKQSGWNELYLIWRGRKIRSRDAAAPVNGFVRGRPQTNKYMNKNLLENADLGHSRLKIHTHRRRSKGRPPHMRACVA